MSPPNAWPANLSETAKLAAQMAKISKLRSHTYAGAAIFLLDKNLGKPGPHPMARRGRRLLQAQNFIKSLPALRKYSDLGGEFAGKTTTGTDEWIIMIVKEQRRSRRWRGDLVRLLDVVRLEMESYLQALRYVRGGEGVGRCDVGVWLDECELDEEWVGDIGNTLDWIEDWCGGYSVRQGSKACGSEVVFGTAMKVGIVFQNLTRTRVTRSPRLRLDIELANYGEFHKILLDKVKKGECLL
ncbi:uncharacterized protein RCC_08811 [Ramularia collo-cygni]|uniref:Uncharacterized protein n=1 Tax=Ramularia collo-cygni TaxID=112498 RepID=A0A2D3VG31_9PEZI|nr:uncharacterized protein RCC_08811 [Ramularia collo-cygni]CZT23101.1 uncharacterized protein RCC_08811 [Ramularia collo-cygni]